TGEFPPNTRWSAYADYPFAAGYSNVGTVVEVGQGVGKLKPGDRVACTAGHTTYALHSADHLWPIRDGVDSEAATFATLAEIVMGGVRRSRAMFGESVAI